MLPLTAATEGILNRRTLFKLPQGSYVINVARGGLVVDEDLLAALDAGHVAGATLDVFHEEPLPAAHPYWRHPKVLITPHASAITLIDESAAQVAAKIRRLERGEPVTGVVDLARGY
jgi:glyoxylate/hydroxypyruvate reductase A